MWKKAMSNRSPGTKPRHKKNNGHKYLLPMLAVLLSACSAPHPVANCTSVTCRPQPDARQLVIWWSPDLRSGPADFSRVSVDD